MQSHLQREQTRINGKFVISQTCYIKFVSLRVQSVTSSTAITTTIMHYYMEDCFIVSEFTSQKVNPSERGVKLYAQPAADKKSSTCCIL